MIEKIVVTWIAMKATFEIIGFVFLILLLIAWLALIISANRK